MKTPVAVALIVMGTVLVLVPIGADYLFQRNLVSLLRLFMESSPACRADTVVSSNHQFDVTGRIKNSQCRSN